MQSMPHHHSVALCPRAKMPAAVDIDDSLTIEACSRSPNLDCNRGCLPQLRFCADELDEFLAPHAQKWCSICGSMLTSEDWYASRLATKGIYGNHLDDSRAIDGNRQGICWYCDQRLLRR